MEFHSKQDAKKSEANTVKVQKEELKELKKLAQEKKPPKFKQKGADVRKVVSEHTKKCHNHVFNELVTTRREEINQALKDIRVQKMADQLKGKAGKDFSKQLQIEKAMLPSKHQIKNLSQEILSRIENFEVPEYQASLKKTIPVIISQKFVADPEKCKEFREKLVMSRTLQRILLSKIPDVTESDTLTAIATVSSKYLEVVAGI